MTLQRPYMPSSRASEDIFRNVVLPLALPADKFVRAVEFQPGSAPVVHHAVISIDRTRASRRRDGADGQVGYDGMITQDAQSPDGHFLGWTPGPRTDRLAGGHAVAARSRQRSRRAAAPAARQEARAPCSRRSGCSSPTRRRRMRRSWSSWDRRRSTSPPVSATTRSPTRYVLPVDVDVLSVYPHAHYLGKEMQALATLPDGSTKWLLRIKRWSFHWQQDYRYVTPIALPRGTTVSMKYTYDNSEDNEDNPHDPPKPVVYGPDSTDEMGDLWLQVLPHSAADAAELVKAFAEREALANLAGAEMAVRRDAERREESDVSGRQSRRGWPRLPKRSRISSRRFGSIRNRRRRTTTWRGALLDRSAGWPRRFAHFRQAAALAPDDERMPFNLGYALNAAGQPAEAARAFQRAIAINPDFAAAHQNLGVLLESRGQLAEAITHLTRAVELAPDSAEAHSDLGAALGEAGRIDEALVHIRKALEISPGYAPAKENLARLGKKQP